MKQFLKDIIKRTPLYAPLSKLAHRRSYMLWVREGRPAPPPHFVKQMALRHFAEKYGLRILVETGTCYGDMVAAMKGSFSQVYSIELSKEIYEEAKKRFEGDENVLIIHGDSGRELEGIIRRIDQPALFWLDGHYSGGGTARGEKDTPIYEELTHIFNSKQSGHVILIDDARLFGTDPAYPSIAELVRFVISKSPNGRIEVEDDSIRILPAD